AIVILANMAHKLEEILLETALRHVFVTELADLHTFPQRFIINTAVRYLKKMVPPYDLPNAVALRDALTLGQKKICQPVIAHPDDMAVLQYTGGTTGVAKGAMLTHGNLLANMRQ